MKCLEAQFPKSPWYNISGRCVRPFSLSKDLQNRGRRRISVISREVIFQMDKTHDARIQLSENPNIGLLMSYPTIATIGVAAPKKDSANNAKVLFDMISNCMYQIWEGEETYDCMDYSQKDKLSFLESLNHQQFEKIQTFFETMPTIKHDIEVENPKTGVKSTMTLSGMNDFF